MYIMDYTEYEDSAVLRKENQPNSSHSQVSEQNSGRGTGASTSVLQDKNSKNPDLPSSETQMRLPSFCASDQAGLTGLRNIGNTCFMNAVIQCLSRSTLMLRFFLNRKYRRHISKNPSGTDGSLLKAFGSIVEQLWKRDHVVGLTLFKCELEQFAPQFKGTSQQDAHEFLRYLLQGIHEDCKKEAIEETPKLTKEDSDTLADDEKASDHWKHYRNANKSKILDIFVGQFKSSLTCTHCEYSSVSFTPFWDISLPILSDCSGTTGLEQCFKALFEDEILCGTESPMCFNCKTPRKSKKSLAIQRFPRVLVLHLNRFSSEGKIQKLNTFVDFPLDGLNLEEYASLDDPRGKYNLFAVANHSGSYTGGHYTAYCKHPYSGQWDVFNDTKISPIAADRVVTMKGYLLFYENVGKSSPLPETLENLKIC